MRIGIHFIRGRQRIILSVLFLLCTIIANAETITYNFSIDDFEITKENGVTFVKSRDPLVSYGNPGTPVLPVFSRQILCPYKFNYVDYFPDVVLSRIPASNSGEISEFTKKIIRYEKYLDNINKVPSVLYAGGYCYKTENDLSDAHIVAIESSEIVGSHDIPYDFVFDTGTTLGDQDYMDYVYDADSIFSEAIQSGYDLVSVQTHGEKDRWKDPLYFTMASADKLCNRHSSVILTAACETAAFDNAYGCLGSSLLLNPSGGCVAYIGSSRSSWYSVSKAEGLNVFSPLLITNMISDLCVNPDHSIGKVFFNSKQNSKYAEDDRYFWLYFSNCMLGDSYQKSYSKFPATLELVPVYDEGRLSLKSVENDLMAESTSYIIKDIDTDDYCTCVIEGLDDVPLGAKEFTVSVMKENYLPYVAKVAVVRDRVIDSSVEVSADIILLGPNLRISEKGSLTLRGKEIIQAPEILVESGGNLNIDSNDKD